jgi:hypothetical protein
MVAEVGAINNIFVTSTMQANPVTGQMMQMITVKYYVGSHGPFYMRFPQSGFDKIAVLEAMRGMQSSIGDIVSGASGS